MNQHTRLMRLPLKKVVELATVLGLHIPGHVKLGYPFMRGGINHFLKRYYVRRIVILNGENHERYYLTPVSGSRTCSGGD